MADLAVRHLVKDHRDIEKILAELESLLDAQKFDTRWTMDNGEALARIVLSLGRKLAGHIRKEEEVLFPALDGLLPRDAGPLTVLRNEHADLCRNFCGMCRVVHSVDQPNQRSMGTGEFQGYSHATIQIMRDHIYKEDRVLFPLVARFLTPELDGKLLEQMEAISRSKAANGQAG